MWARSAVALTIALSLSASAIGDEEHHVSFIACPLYRDVVGRDCWLAEYAGSVFYIGRFGVSQPPELLHRVLIQGTVSAQSSCGGTVIQPLSLSVLPEIDRSCDTVLPANGDRPSEPSIFDDAKVLVMVGQPMPPAHGPFITRTIPITFGYNTEFIDQQMQMQLEQAYQYLHAGHAKTVTVTGRATNVRLDDGSTLREGETIPRRRAVNVARALKAMGLQRTRLTVKWDAAASPGDGVHDPLNRRVDVQIAFAR